MVKYSTEFKLQVVEENLDETAINFGITSPATIISWKKKLTEERKEALFKPNGRPQKDMTSRKKTPTEEVETKELTKLEQLEAEILRLKNENEYLKKLQEYGLPPRSHATKSKP